eukprot:c19951_g3_i1 orf=237-413(-)
MIVKRDGSFHMDSRGSLYIEFVIVSMQEHCPILLGGEQAFGNSSFNKFYNMSFKDHLH